jgi:hypothetical protein
VKADGPSWSVQPPILERDMDRRAERDGMISGFLTTAGWGSAARTALAGDASFRRYWRLTDGARQQKQILDEEIAMDHRVGHGARC